MPHIGAPIDRDEPDDRWDGDLLDPGDDEVDLTDQEVKDRLDRLASAGRD